MADIRVGKVAVLDLSAWGAEQSGIRQHVQMTELATPDRYASHSVFTDPGAYATLIGGLPRDIAALCRTLQGLLIHEAWIERQGLDPADFSGQSRATLPVARRLEQLLTIAPGPLSIARPGASRALATCRDFSLMMCAVLRHHGRPARLRCGFGKYFTGHPLHDHWVCEYWARDAQRWVLVDAELDELHRSLLKFDFDPTDVPRTEFITGIEAWKRCRSGAIDPAQLGHGSTTRSVLCPRQLGARSARTRGDRDLGMGYMARGGRAEPGIGRRCLVAL
ncbi:transglutaminase-like domain-containing protein [Bradyrhizobium sp. 1]|uniref:transglutaminase-like domain-containing protein n=1 Tax=Bradyrhizobium sp. 1 TaxID=241591 RepID=UPI001FF9E87A|nr:transglutaminase-like domain-containing protein [Bradyrhizobium sp. 1]MCK1390934.1 transglutaminase domain-containing protein [Bradyrhizobium sp. 1]